MELLFNEIGVTVTDTAIYNALCKEIASMYGDFGIAAAKPSLSVKVIGMNLFTIFIFFILKFIVVFLIFLLIVGF